MLCTGGASLQQRTALVIDAREFINSRPPVFRKLSFVSLGARLIFLDYKTIS